MRQERVIAYIDGFNLYYGAVKRTPYKWLNLQELCLKYLGATDDLIAINYYTARVAARPGDADAPVRQQMFLRALQTIPILSVHYGHFLTHPVRMPIAATVIAGRKPEYVEVLKTEEKGSDVNLASHLLRDAYNDAFTLALVVTNDSDLVEPIRIVREELKKRVGILNPHKLPSAALQKNADFVKAIRKGVLSDCQFPAVMSDSRGEFRKPDAW